MEQSEEMGGIIKVIEKRDGEPEEKPGIFNQGLQTEEMEGRAMRVLEVMFNNMENNLSFEDFRRDMLDYEKNHTEW